MLFILYKGEANLGLRKLNLKYIASNNTNIIGSLISITGSNRFRDFDSQVILNTLSNSRVFTLNDIRILDIVNLTRKITTSLPIGFLKGYLV